MPSCCLSPKASADAAGIDEGRQFGDASDTTIPRWVANAVRIIGYVLGLYALKWLLYANILCTGLTVDTVSLNFAAAFAIIGLRYSGTAAVCISPFL